MAYRAREVLCIGGKHDGRRTKVKEDAGYVQLVDQIPTSVPIWSEPTAPMTTVEKLSVSVYVIETIKIKDRTFYIGRPTEQPFDSTIAMLLQGYRGI